MGEAGSEDGRATSFGAVADAYERGRPAYPAEAAAWLVGDRPGRVLELGAGTGKLTRELLALGHEVLATDPDPAMLEVLARELPEARTLVGTAEGLGDLDVPDQSVDVVVAAQCFHWFDTEVALPAIARVLRPGGSLALVWNEPDLRVPWVRRLAGLLGVRDEPLDPTDDLLDSELFVDVEHATYKHRHQLDRTSVLDLAASRSGIATLDAERRERALGAVLELYDDYGRGMDGMLLPYFTHCYRAGVVELHIERPAQLDEMTDTIPRELRGTVRPARPSDLPGMQDLDDSQMILIDFR